MELKKIEVPVSNSRAYKPSTVSIWIMATGIAIPIDFYIAILCIFAEMGLWGGQFDLYLFISYLLIPASWGGFVFVVGFLGHFLGRETEKPTSIKEVLSKATYIVLVSNATVFFFGLPIVILLGFIFDSQTEPLSTFSLFVLAGASIFWPAVIYLVRRGRKYNN